MKSEFCVNGYTFQLNSDVSVLEYGKGGKVVSVADLDVGHLALCISDMFNAASTFLGEDEAYELAERVVEIANEYRGV